MDKESREQTADISHIPHAPGCYLFKDRSLKIIYIGKAKDLKKRAASYFQKRILDPKTAVLISKVGSIDFIVTQDETEALILENRLIKRHAPRYNIVFKDAKNYSSILKTDEKYPRFITARRREQKGRYYGPFVSGIDRSYILRLINKIFMLRTCKKMPKKPCLRHHIQICSAPCIQAVSHEAYLSQVKKAEMVLKGRTGELIRSLSVEMSRYAKKQEYENALEIKNQIDALGHLEHKQNIERAKRFDEDVISYAVKDDYVYIIVFNIYKGTLSTKHEFSFQRTPEFFDEFILQFYSENPVPKELIVPIRIDPGLNEFLSRRRSEESPAASKVIVTVPKRGEKKQLLDLAHKNIELSFFSDLEALKELEERLKLDEMPHIIECFDISHLSGTSTVGSMVQFRAGKPDRSNYRRFRIRSVEGIDDYAAIAEVIRRRYARVKQEELELAHLIVIDGGKGQLSAALGELRELGLKIPIISLAKRDEEIFVPGLSAPLRLDKRSKALHLLQRLRDEAHRFALSYNRLLRKKEAIR